MKKEMYEQIEENQRTHWWYIGRKEIVLEQIKKIISPSKSSNIIDIGAGCGFILNDLKKFGKVFAVENSDYALEHLVNTKNVKVQKAMLPDERPFENTKFDLITALDVIEHIKDDEGTLKLFREMLTDKGKLVITVPAFWFLWSEHDEINMHYRRYSMKELVVKLKKAGFKVRKATYFNTFLFPAVFAVRFFSNLFHIKSNNLSMANEGFSNKVLTEVLRFEKALIRFMNLPFGVSILVVASKEK